MNVQLTCVFSTTYSEKTTTWFTNNYATFKSRVLADELSELPASERTLLLDYVSKREWLHRAIKEASSKTAGENEKKFMELLVEFGMDLNAIDSTGKSVLAYAEDLKILQWLYKKGALFVDSESSFLQLIIQSSQHKEKEETDAILLEILPALPLENFYGLSEEIIHNFFNTVAEIPGMQIFLQKIALQMIEKQPEEAILIIEKLLGYGNEKELAQQFFRLVENKIIPESFIEKILTNKNVLYFYIHSRSFFNFLANHWTPRSELNTLSMICGELRLALLIQAILNTTNLEQTALLCNLLYGNIFHNLDLINLHQEAKKYFTSHIMTLQEKEKTTIWHKLNLIDSGHLTILVHLGLNLAWEDSNNRTFLFTKNIRIALEDPSIKEMIPNCQHTDINGDNALEYFCRKTKFCSKTIESLTDLGLKLGDQFPNVDECRTLFPKDTYLQTFFAACLLNPNKFFLQYILSIFSEEDKENFINNISKVPRLYKILITAISSKSLDINVETEGWSNKFHEESLKTIEFDPSGDCQIKKFLARVSSFWKEKIPPNIFSIIPEAPLACLVIATIKKQYRQIAKEKRLSAIAPSELFRGLRTHNDFVYFNRYLFDHPEIMSFLVQIYMKADYVNIKPGGSTKTTYAAFTLSIMDRAKRFLQRPKSAHFLTNDHQKKIFQAFKKYVPPIPIETLPIPDTAQIRLLGRTAIITDGEESIAFKFLKEGESYFRFSQEMCVTEAFNNAKDSFKSQFIKPIAIYAVKKLPSVFTPFLNELSKEKSAFVFHYKASPETFEYLQNLPAEKYAEGRILFLHDAAKMTLMGIYPDLAAIFHNTQSKRKYVLLLDLMILFSQRYSSSSFSPEGGAGRLDEPFNKIKYPNVRQTGLTDLRDASLLYGNRADLPGYQIRDMRDLQDITRNGTRYYLQMFSLSNALLIDALILAERLFKEGLLQWKNEKSVELFGSELAKGFALIFSSYAGKEEKKCLKFSLNCGIDWTRAARQIAFWMDSSEEGYPSFAAQGKIPEGIYEEEAHIHVDISKAKNFDPVKGFCSNGNLDIGAFNGPLALTEFEKAMHLTFHIVAMAEPLSD